MKTQSVLFVLGAWLLASCANPASGPAVVDTSDPRFLVGTLISWEASQDSGQSVEDPADWLASDAPVTAERAASRSMGPATVVVDGDTVTLTRTGTHWSGVVLTKVMVRSVRPTTVELPNPGDTLTQTGSESWYLGNNTSGTPFASITVTMDWRNQAGTVVLAAASRTGERIGFGSATPHVLTIDATYLNGALASKTVDHYTVSVDPAHWLFRETFAKTAGANGSTITTITRTDPEGALLNRRVVTASSDGHSETIERYNADAVLRETASRSESGNGWTVTRTTYRKDGFTVKATTSETVAITTSGNTTSMIREVTAADGTVYRVTMEVTVNGNEYAIAKTEGGVLLRWTALKGPDGLWTITPEGETPLILDADEAV